MTVVVSLGQLIVSVARLTTAMNQMLEYPTCIELTVHVRVLKPLTGVVDGVSLSSLVPGFVYELDDTTAEYLFELHAGTPVRSTDPPTSEEFEDIDIAWLSGGVHVIQSDTADEKPARRRGKRR